MAITIGSLLKQLAVDVLSGSPGEEAGKTLEFCRETVSSGVRELHGNAPLRGELRPMPEVSQVVDVEGYASEKQGAE
jgi:hypothetical protein